MGKVKSNILALLSVFGLFYAIEGKSQTTLEGISLNDPLFQVGFRNYTSFDASRTYSRLYEFNSTKYARPISVSIWYPAEKVEGRKRMGVLDFMEILKVEEEWDFLPNEQILNWFYYANTPENQEHLLEASNSFFEAEEKKGDFPVVIYAPSFQASSIENFALCEYLASQGFVVIASASQGTETRFFGENFPKEIETQARDVEFLMQEAIELRNVDLDRIAVMGYSFGGLANIIVQNRNDLVKAVVSLDGTERYQYHLLEKSPFFSPKKLDVPYLHLAQKDIPEQVLREEGIDAKLNKEFQLFDSLSRSQASQVKFNDLTHSYFSTLGVLFADRDKRQDKSDQEIMYSYKCLTTYVTIFLKAALYQDAESILFMKNADSGREVASGLISLKKKDLEEKDFGFQDFNELAVRQDYEDLDGLYRSILQTHPDFAIAESNLNLLGLQLVFNPSTSAQGIKVFLFGTRLFPNSANLFDSLGEGYLFIGNRVEAKTSFERSLELYPDNLNAIARLKQLQDSDK